MKDHTIMTPNAVMAGGVEAPSHDENDPMDVDIGIGEIRAQVAQLNDPNLTPDAAEAIIRQRIATGEITTLYAELRKNYDAACAGTRTDGDVFAFLEMEYNAFRQIMDDNVPDFRPELHEGLLKLALSLPVDVQLPLRMRAAHDMLSIPSPLTRKRNDALNAILLGIIAAASRAARIGSDSYRIWRDALAIIVKKEFQRDGSMREDDIRRLVDGLASANMALFLDAVIADYQPTSRAKKGEEGADGEETDDVL